MALPARLARFQVLLDFLVEAALREIDDDASHDAAARSVTEHVGSNAHELPSAPEARSAGARPDARPRQRSGLDRGVDKP